MSLWTDDPKPSAYTPPPPPPADDPPPAPPAREPRAPRPWLAAVGGGVVSAVVVSAVLLGTGLAGNDNTPATTAAPSNPAPVSISASDAKGDLVRTIYAAASPSVASVRTGQGSGTGFLVDSNGTVVTNAHVVGQSGNVQVRFNDKGAYHDAKVLSVDASTDLAAVKVDASAVQGIRPLELADSDKAQVGDSVVAIGYPLGLDRTATAGIVSGLERQIQSPNGFSIDKVIQTDAAVNPGNSGGPLLNAKGQVIGVNSQIATAAGGGDGNVGIAFAIPANTVKQVLPALESGTQVKHAYLGLQTTAPRGGGSGAEIAQTTPSGPGDRAGLQPGDIVVKVGGTAISSPDDVANAIADDKPGDKVDVTVERNGSRHTVTVTLGQRPEQVPSQIQQPTFP
ncbi:MAG: S1C family serine protease [Solirubrobacterales bacterium]